MSNILLCLVVLSGSILNAQSSSLPGRQGSEEICTARFGKTRMFFYMTPKKYELAKNFVHDVNNNMLHTMTNAEIGCSVCEVTPVATTDPAPIAFNSKREPIYLDHRGTLIFRKHCSDVRKFAQEALGINIYALSQEMSMIMNYDANKFHQDQCPIQYQFLKEHKGPIPKYTIFQDLTLIDWEMGDSTFSGTILEDEDSEDSFIMCFFNNEIACNVYTEPAIYCGPHKAPEYPGAATLAPHSPIPSIDLCAGDTVGSCKGKRMSVAVRGLVRTEEVDSLESRARVLHVDRPSVSTLTNGVKDYSYGGNILCRDFQQHSIPTIQLSQISRLKDMDHIEVYSSLPARNPEITRFLLAAFKADIDPLEVQIRHLIKRGPGFSRINLEELELKGDCDIIIVNTSQIPDNYRHYPIAEDCTKSGMPWMHLYHLPHSRVMNLSCAKFSSLLLTPIDEIMFRDGIFDIESSDPNEILCKFYTSLHIFAIPKQG